MKTKTHLTWLLAATISATGIQSAFSQGSLTPPGAPAPTMKSLNQIEPRTAINATNTPGDADSLFKITAPGSYYLTGNITGVVGKHGVEIAVGGGGVTLDLNGFDLEGVPGMGFFHGVCATVFPMTNIAVVNGSVRNWGGVGVELSFSLVSNCRVERVLVSGNASNGINAGLTSTISHCAAYQNSVGITAGSGSTVSNCAASQNTGGGISVGGSGCTVSHCSAVGNTGHGINIGSGTIIGCTATSNTLDGIRCNFACVILSNACFANGQGLDVGAGIHATAIDNRIEGNNCAGADRGIDVDAAGNIIIRNTCSGNTTANWDIVANNVCGPILDLTAPASAAILGNSAPSSLGSTDPNANFTY